MDRIKLRKINLIFLINSNELHIMIKLKCKVNSNKTNSLVILLFKLFLQLKLTLKNLTTVNVKLWGNINSNILSRLIEKMQHTFAKFQNIEQRILICLIDVTSCLKAYFFC